MMSNYYPPKAHNSAFNCPHCQAYSNQKWYGMTLTSQDRTASYVDISTSGFKFLYMYSLSQKVFLD